MSSIPSNERIIWADVCRILAVFGVIVIHSSGELFYSYGKVSTDYWLSANFWDSLSRVAVPLFVMLSGSLLLKSKKILNFKVHSILKRVGRVFFPLVTWSVVYLLWLRDPSSAPINIFEWIGKFFSEPVMYHLWFVYMVIGLYIIIPILQVIFLSCENDSRLKWYLFSIWFAINSLTIYIPMPFLLHMQIQPLLEYPGYFILGGILGMSSRDILFQYHWGLLFLIGFLLTFFIVWIRTYDSGVPDELGYAYFSPNVLFSSIGAFMCIQRIRIQGVWAKIIHWLSDVSFPIYFVHIMSLEYIRYGLFGIKFSTKDFYPFFSILALAIAVFIVSLMVASVLRVIPGSRRIFG
ncbi:O-acetyltransferase WecH [Methylococcales bacterium]|nr:O-acetyltransferase WecH [Methylococcales bacterium]